MRPRSILVLALALATAACAAAHPAAAPPPAPVPAPEEARCGPDETFRDCAYRAETPALARVEGRAWRSGDTLRFATDHVGVTSLISDVEEGDRYIVYRYVERLDRERLHLVAYHLYEGGGYVLVDERSGRQVTLGAPPVVSPGRTRFAVASVDLTAFYQPNVVQVWRFADGPPVMEWGLEGGERWGAESPVWRSETVLDFVRVERDDDGASERRIPMRLRMVGGGIEVRPR
jgi:hypothetical protein